MVSAKAMRLMDENEAVAVTRTYGMNGHEAMNSEEQGRRPTGRNPKR